MAQAAAKVAIAVTRLELGNTSRVKVIGTVGEYRIDLIVENEVILEIKSVERHDPIFDAQLLT